MKAWVDDIVRTDENAESNEARDIANSQLYHFVGCTASGDVLRWTKRSRSSLDLHPFSFPAHKVNVLLHPASPAAMSVASTTQNTQPSGASGEAKHGNPYG